MRVVVYTALVGDNGDVLRQPLCEQPDDVRLVCFTDRSVRSGGAWEIRPIERRERDARRTARWHKVHSHALFGATEAVVWIDGSFQLRVPAPRLVTEGLGAHNVLATYRHPERSCVYSEHLACQRMKKDDPVVMQRQMDFYKFQGYPPQNGLAETGCLVRAPAACAAFEAEWWATIDRYSSRDQLSFDFAAWRLKLAYGHLEGRAIRSPYFVFHSHKKRRPKRT